MKSYITPNTQKISLSAESTTLYASSEIPIGDQPGYFDTKQQHSPIWLDDDSDA